MAHPQQPHPPPSSQSLISRPSHNQSQIVTSRANMRHEVSGSLPQLSRNKQPIHEGSATRTIPLPSLEELDRMKRYIALQKRSANLESISRKGHTYGKLAVSDSGRAIRGNVYGDSGALPHSRSHTYGQGEVRDNGMILQGDIRVPTFQNCRS